MNYEANISPVDPHPECVRRHGYITVVLCKIVLCFFTSGVINTAVITDNTNAP